jgi:hypothetical protein
MERPTGCCRRTAAMKKVRQRSALMIACFFPVLPACTAMKRQTMIVKFTNARTQTVMLEKPDFGPSYDEKADEKAMREI